MISVCLKYLIPISCFLFLGAIVWPLAMKAGTMQVKSADLRLDLNDVPASQVNVVLNARSAKAGAFFFTEAMKSAASTTPAGDSQGAGG